MKHIESHTGEGEVQRERGGPIGACSYRIDVYQEQISTDHLRAPSPGSKGGLNEFEIQEIAMQSGAVLPLATDLLLVMSDGRKLPFRVDRPGSFTVMGGPRQ